MSRKQIELICPECLEKYFKAESEFKRNEKLGRISYCSRSCGTKARNRIPKVKNQLNNYSNSIENKNHLKTTCNNRRDEFTPFRLTLKCTKQRKTHDNNLDLEYLKELWEIQCGICPYTKFKLELPEYNNSNIIHPTVRASLDRINSSLGYIKGNVQYVSTPINYMKNTMSHEETIEFLQQITKTLSLDRD